ncbi:hypothetical protein ABIE62_001609 [Porphyrobacter sp. MBR-155]|jgi:hypothetical protein|uniref:hypothetical protein n=1 Tax=Porphyrobacter sp. MBR-155 TaxID=3156464 RepID=UPI00339197C9
MIRRVIALTALGLALSGCVGGARPAADRAAPRSAIVVVPQVMAAQGLGGVIGSPAGALTRRFGAPRIDLAEGDARKLQFAGPSCVLDIFLYPLSAGAEPTATHVDARLRQGGATVDQGACIRELETR